MYSADTISALRNYLFIGIGGSVLALDPDTGAEIWRNKLMSGSTFTSIVQYTNRLYAATSGELYCLDPVDGSLLWHNKLKGLGLGYITFAVAADQSAATTAAASAAAAASSAAV